MSLMDLLRMSCSNLKRRKLRTFLTVLGVIIGTASIVVMISLGLGMQQSMYDQVEEFGGLTTITVTGKGSEGGSGMIMMDDAESSEEDVTEYVTDDTIKKLANLEDVSAVSPVYEMQAILKTGKYQAYCSLIGMKPDELERQNIPLAEGGKLPEANTSQLELVMGNGMVTMFDDGSGNMGYSEDGTYADIDFMKDSLFLIMNTSSYENAESEGMGMGEEYDTGEGEEGSGEPQSSKPAKKHNVRVSGMVEGTPEDWNAHSYSVYCDIDTLLSTAKKEFGAETKIPGQPTTESGKPLKFFTYTSAKVKVDDIDKVEDVAKAIREMGYSAANNMDFLKSMQSQFLIVQAVLGGIGGISLFVAAIGIANTMMMSIYERTKEIGVIKVLGCSLKNIKQMFLLEASFIGLLGGIIGNILSFLLSLVINWIAGAGMGEMVGESVEKISYIPVWLILVSMAFAMLVGVAAGYFPALRAMRLSPLAAIRNE